MMQKQKRLTIHDLHKIERRLMRYVAKYLKVLKRLKSTEGTDWVQVKRVLQVTYKGDPRRLKGPLEDKGFSFESKVLADANVVRFLKCFVHMGLKYTARIACLCDFKRMSVSLTVETPPEVFNYADPTHQTETPAVHRADRTRALTRKRGRRALH